MYRGLLNIGRSVTDYLWADQQESNENFFIYHEYDQRHLVKVELDETTLRLYSVTDEEYVENIKMTDIIGSTVTEQIFNIGYCKKLLNSDRIYHEIILESTIETIPEWFNQINKNIISHSALVIINPAGGSQTALIEYDTTIKQILINARFEVTSYVTQQQGDANQYIKYVDLRLYDRLIVLGGDGTVSEVVNGLIARDEVDSLAIPIGIMPLGSGNGLVRSILHEAGEHFGRISSLYQIIKGDVKQIPLISNLIGVNMTYSFLANGWGLPSDVDIESEMYRFIGSMRFIIGIIIRLINLRCYYGKISYIPIDKTDKDWVEITNDAGFVLMWCCNAPYVAEDMLVAPDMSLSAERMNLIFIKYPVTRYELLTLFLSLERGEHINSKIVESYQASAVMLEPYDTTGNITIDGELVEYKKVVSYVSDKKFSIIG